MTNRVIDRNHAVARIVRIAERALAPVLCSILLLCLAACEDYEIAHRGTKFNDSLQDYASQQLLLNIARAANDLPIEFAAVSSITTSSPLSQVQLGLSVPYGPGPSTKPGLSPSITGQEGITVSWTPLETSDFYSQILNPVTAQDLVYYFQNLGVFDQIFPLFAETVTMKPATFVFLHDWALKEGQALPRGDTYRCFGDFYDPNHARDPEGKAPPCFKIPNDDDLHRIAKDDPHNAACNDIENLATNPYAVPTDYDGKLAFDSMPSDPCQYFRFQYLTKILDELYYNFRVAVVDPGGASSSSSKTGSKSKSSGSSANANTGSSSATATGGGPSNSSGPTSPGAVGQTGPTNAYLLELHFPTNPLDKPPALYTCQRPHELYEQLENVSTYANALSRYGAYSLSLDSVPLTLANPQIHPQIDLGSALGQGAVNLGVPKPPTTTETAPAAAPAPAAPDATKTTTTKTHSERRTTADGVTVTDTTTTAPASPPSGNQSAAAQTSGSASWTEGPTRAWFKHVSNHLAADSFAVPDMMVFNMNDRADQTIATNIGPITSLSDLQAALLTILGEFGGKDCDVDAMPAIQLRSPAAMLDFLGQALSAPETTGDLFARKEDHPYCPGETAGYYPSYMKVRYLIGNPKPPYEFDRYAIFGACDASANPASAALLGSSPLTASVAGKSYYLLPSDYLPSSSFSDNAQNSIVLKDDTLVTIRLLREIISLQTVSSQLQTVPILRVLGQ